MNILVVGASHGTGAQAVRAALDKGHGVTAFARSPRKLALEHRNLRKFAGDFHLPSDVAAAVPGHDAVVVTASASRLRAYKENPFYFSHGTQNVIDAMNGATIRRLVVLSALGTGESRQLMNPIVRRLAVDGVLRLPYEDHERQEDLVRASGLDWVIVRPTRLTNGAAHGRYVATTALQRVPSSISRADLGEFVIRACDEPAWVGHAVQIGG